MTRRFSAFLFAAATLPVAVAHAQPPAAAVSPPAIVPPVVYPAVVVEAEDFKPQDASGWKTVFNGQGNYMVDIIGFQHISGERVLSAPANSKNARAVAQVQIPQNGAYRLWARFEQPTNVENRFRVEVRQNGRLVGQGVMGQKDAPKYFFGSKTPVAQADASWGSEGLVEQSFDLKNLSIGPAEITLVAIDQPAPAANRNVDFLFLTQDTTDTWRTTKNNRYYAILDAALDAIPPRYYLRVTSPTAQTVVLRLVLNRLPWNRNEATIKLNANEASAWIPLRQQDVAHFTTLNIIGPAGKGLQVRAELASAPDEKKMLRVLDWNDAGSNELLVGLPPYPNKYAGERILTVEEQYRNIAAILRANPSKVGREPVLPLAYGAMPVWSRGRVNNAAAEVFHEAGLRTFGVLPLKGNPANAAASLEVARERFAKWNQPLTRSIGVGAYRSPPTPENLALAKAIVEKNNLQGLLQRYDYGDEIAFFEWLKPLGEEELKTRFAAWQQKKHGAVRYQTPDSTSDAAAKDPILYADSQAFYEDAAIEYVASQAREIPKVLGPEVLYGANVAAHPFYYPEIAKYVKWFRPTASGDYAANFGRHSEYFWQIGQPGPLVNGFIADHFTAGMKENPQAQLIQYTMPHSPGNTDASFRRSAFTHLAHGARGLDYFGAGINNSFTENYIDFRDAGRYAAIRDVNRAMASIEDILPTSRQVPSRIALVLSDSTERWDLAEIATAGAGFNYGDGYKKARLAYHFERLGLYYALVHNSRAPDLLTEEDVQRGDLKNYTVAYWTGDCAMPATVTSLRGWVESGGHLVATAGALRNDEYNRPVAAGNALLGLASASLEQRDRFFRPQIEMPYLKPLDTLGAMPALAFLDTVSPAPGARVLQSFRSGKPAVIENTIGQGRTTFIATLPGVAYLWGAYQPAPVPSRGPASHMELGGFNRAAGALMVAPARIAASPIEANGSWIDARLIQWPAGFAIPFANYSPDIKAPVTLTVRVPNITGISSAVAGKLNATRAADGALTVRYVPGYGDILRLEQ